MSATPPPQEEASRSTARRDQLLTIQRWAQIEWAQEHLFEEDAPNPPPEEKSKYFVSFPYPYMNGKIHLGHAFSLSKTEFAVGFWRLMGKQCLFPMGFHCTGMPIKACADKLKHELEQRDQESSAEAAAPATAAAAPAAAATSGFQEGQVGVFKSHKAKAASKKGPGATQYEIMQKMGIPDAEIPKFADPLHWLHYFPAVAKEDLTRFGVRCDWRRSFITTTVNPYYDSFIRWQFTTLHEMNLIRFGKRSVPGPPHSHPPLLSGSNSARNTIWSPIDGQPCADHDRAEGEGVQPQDYTIIKLRIAELPACLACLQGRDVFLGAATLRPETMYGQTNCWVGPDCEYGAYELANGEVLVCSARAALNLSFQNQSKVFGKPHNLLGDRMVLGRDLIGTPLRAPLTSYPVVYVLPMMNVSATKGTGVVTSVPSDAPDDYQALQDLREKAAFRQKFGVRDEWVLPFAVVPIIEIPGFGTESAKAACEQLKVASQNDREKLDKAKEMVYMKGFYEGVMRVGEQAGRKVAEAKPLIRELLLRTGQAMAYSEPEKPIISRSGNECVVALTDQWYIAYGEEDWKQKALDCLSRMETFSPEVRKMFLSTLGILHEWACSRSFGLGSRLPWDDRVLIESLSDSTIYMAYYTVAHMLQGADNLEGTRPGPSGLLPGDMTREAWDFVFMGKPLPGSVPAEVAAKLQPLRNEFTYWYPLDLRVSGKDLIPNHLTFWIYNHVAMFPPELWPREVRANGHLLIDGAKMSKSTGNFLTLEEANNLYSADAVRLGLADAGDGIEDANFERTTGNAAILRLTKELAWIEEVFKAKDQLRPAPACISPATSPVAAAPVASAAAAAAAAGGLDVEGISSELMCFFDRVFEAQINRAIEQATYAYSRMLFREALRVGFYELQVARDAYRQALGERGMRADLVRRFVEVEVLLLAPICPHWCEHVWKVILGNPASIHKARWPTAGVVDQCRLMAAQYLFDTISQLRQTLQKMKTKKAAPGTPTNNALVLFAIDEYFPWQLAVLRMMRGLLDRSDQPDLSGVDVAAALKEDPALAKNMKKAMPFASFVKADVTRRGVSALDLRRSFSETEVLAMCREYMAKQLGLDRIDVVPVRAAPATDAVEPAGELPSHVAPLVTPQVHTKLQSVTPGSPQPLFYSAPMAAPAPASTQ
ncbi:putative Leucine--tRNA ligase [Paratrimastix pyriformis]|uniref:leucine--tRNA ligase n=1 Tax=Paratrimastix pyriformis TaxID=342808 RepID=A0ABQ8URH5_9EUKA|nr:putative Leucine--tRNA ligase [Paratrimastix pyriformis]